MGFDMRFVLPPANLPDWYQPIEPEEPGYYQLTFGGMFEVVAAMAAAGLLDEEVPVPLLPDWPPLGLTTERAGELQASLHDSAKLDELIQPHERTAVAEFLGHFTGATGQRSAYEGRVPGYKFRSNDGWLVTPEECRVIADGLDAALDGERDELVHRLRERGYSRTADTVWDLLFWWAKYNRVAVDHGGYRVW